MAFNPSDEELRNCQRWFKYILIPFSRTENPPTASYLADSWSVRTVGKACARIMQVISNRVFDMNVGGETDQAFDSLSKQTYIINPADVGSTGRVDDPENTYRLTVSLMTGFLAYICLTKHIFWDEKGHSEYEINYFKQTKLGKALWSANCFISQQQAILQKGLAQVDWGLNSLSQPAQSRSVSTGSSAGKIQRTISLQNCGGLVSPDKVVPSVSKVFFIQGEWITPKKTTPRIYVTPNVAAQKTLKVNLSSGQGFDDCVLYFDSLDKANEFMLKCANIAPAKVQNLTTRKQSTDQNGYFKVNTEFGEALIKAARLGA